MEKRKLGLLGSGFLSGIIAEAMHNGLLPEYELVGIAGRNPVTTQEMAQKYGCKACLSSDELLALQPDYIAEAASGAAVSGNCSQSALGRFPISSYSPWALLQIQIFTNR